MGLVVLCLGLAGSSTESRVVWIGVEKTHAVVAAERRVDGRWQTCWGLETLDSGQRLHHLTVTIATSNYNLKVATPLTCVGGSLA